MPELLGFVFVLFFRELFSKDCGVTPANVCYLNQCVKEFTFSCRYFSWNYRTNGVFLSTETNKSSFLNVSVMGELEKRVRKSTEYGKKM